jgi:hypothetical protein
LRGALADESDAESRVPLRGDAPPADPGSNWCVGASIRYRCHWQDSRRQSSRRAGSYADLLLKFKLRHYRFPHIAMLGFYA